MPKKQKLFLFLMIAILVGMVFMLMGCQKAEWPMKEIQDNQKSQPIQEALPDGESPLLALAACKDEGCLYKNVPRDQLTNFSPDDCKSLDNQKTADFGKYDLGMLCRLVIARSKASFRKTDPCKNSKSLNPDYDGAVKEKMGLEMFNLSLRDQLLQKYGISPLSDFHGYNNSTIHGSYVYDYQSHEKDGQKRPVSFGTYFCLSGNPAHYTPYFYVLEVNEESKAMDFIETPPVLEAVIAQFDKNKDAIESLRDRLWDIEKTFLADLNGDGRKDLLLVFKDDREEGYLPAVCFFNINGDQCLMKEAKNFFKSSNGKSIDDSIDFMMSEMLVAFPGKNKFQLQVVDKNANNKILGTALYQYAHDGIELVK